MTADQNDGFSGETRPDDRGRDPLGIMGWTIGGKYKVNRHIGGGGFGEVYEGFNVNLPEQRLVMKFFKRVQSRDKFAKEAKILCLLDHPNICRVIDFLPDEGALVIPYIEGKDGAKILRESGPLPEELYLRVARDLTSALAFAHKQRVAHRDIKPGNILIDNNNHVYLIDFGIAKEVGEAATRTAYQALTPQFAAPERQSGDLQYDPFLSDVYELGVTLFNFATNNMPYRNPANPNFREWGGIATENLSPDLLQILRKATHPDPSARFKSVEDMAETFAGLKQVYGGKKTGRKVLIPVIALIVIAVGIAGYLKRDTIAELFGKKTTPVATVTQPAPVDTMRTADADQPKDSATIPVTKPKDVAPMENKTKDRTTAADTKPQTKDTSKTVTRKQPDAAGVKPDITQKPPETPKEEKPQSPPKPTEVALKVSVIPGDGAELRIDNTAVTPERYTRIKPGSHTVAIVHRDYPVYRDEFTVTDDTAVISFDLNREFAQTPLVDLKLVPLPATELLTLSFALNGRAREFDDLSDIQLKRLAGEWQIDVALNPKPGADNLAAMVDSLVTFPFGGGPHLVVTGNSGTMDFGVFAEKGLHTIPLIVFWSER
ncbi:MAG: protein kinase [candidate division Zixibacteria bacterium]|nr:protein kinase [candidate division Zixibacteria bacterium]